MLIIMVAVHVLEADMRRSLSEVYIALIAGAFFCSDPPLSFLGFFLLVSRSLEKILGSDFPLCASRQLTRGGSDSPQTIPQASTSTTHRNDLWVVLNVFRIEFFDIMDCSARHVRSLPKLQIRIP
ncbi:hypothetical protein VNO77_04265 [Canavalia gladiata]|uniref:Uncharacterized protein n=1 Tax=Canavalia gladiata TaxID=3824 RepID=A0AAN9MX20_CANGL